MQANDAAFASNKNLAYRHDEEGWLWMYNVNLGHAVRQVDDTYFEPIDSALCFQFEDWMPVIDSTPGAVN